MSEICYVVHYYMVVHLSVCSPMTFRVVVKMAGFESKFFILVSFMFSPIFMDILVCALILVSCIVNL